jgi:hypothetical protein
MIQLLDSKQASEAQNQNNINAFEIINMLLG